MTNHTDAGLLAGRKAVVTGAGGGMGGAIADMLARHGADLVLNDRNRERVTSSAEAARRHGREVVAVDGDVTQQDDARRVIEAAHSRWGRLDILINVVGGIKGPVVVPLWDITTDQWDATIDLNLHGTFHCTQAALPAMMEQRYGKIVNIASVGWAGEALHTHYAVAKAGVVAFTRSAATQLGPYNINVNAIAPGATARNIAVDMPDSIMPSVSATGPLGRINTPEDIAGTALFLVSEHSRNISGELLTVAGGNTPRL